ncbi:PREDICTED: uncharacterized protein LOC104593189 [Nelumbo nucifera]|uniref:Transmembrane protein n=2 Tax=Nelumbo nucifera TaxID=4432 RepID=A0A822YSL9_NELNU|nr:PREDICTED: uncharacterized protein LOC104593189 [Nelumbo nucifera]DAD34571.1 TPA_asm: hypothetical protein HUJ06_005211 [Nelumbo nucifera]
MDENASRITISRAKEGKKKGLTRRNRFPVPADDVGDLQVKCSGKYCRSCIASFLADCIAVCCCPCAVVNLLALAFVKVPWMVGKRCSRLLKKKRPRLEMEGTKRKETTSVIARNVDLRKERVAEGTPFESPAGLEEDKRKDNCERSEAERVWLELYQVGHLDFGRVSFSGIQGKSN